MFLIQSALWSTFFSWIERKRYSKKIESTPLPDNPIFIIGHWRTGTTLLHQLLNLDTNLAAPTLFQVAEPNCFISSYRYYVPVFSALVAENRPMDNVKIGMNEPQEDEYAIYRITDFSPLERIVFPEDTGYFILNCPSFLPENDADRKEWEQQFIAYFRKLHFFYGKTIVSKNPFNSMRIKELVTLFPGARFIHIVRHPFEVVPSTINMWKIVLEQNRLNRKGSEPGFEEVVQGVDKVLTKIKQDSSLIPEENYFEMKFEDLEADPVAELKKLYERFHLAFDDELGKTIESYIEPLKNYRKNEFHLDEEEKEQIRRQLFKHMDIFNYQ